MSRMAVEMFHLVEVETIHLVAVEMRRHQKDAVEMFHLVEVGIVRLPEVVGTRLMEAGIFRPPEDETLHLEAFAVHRKEKEIAYPSFPRKFLENFVLKAEEIDCL